MYYPAPNKSNGGITIDAKVLERLAPEEISEIARWYEQEGRRLHLVAAERLAKFRAQKQAKNDAEKWAAERRRLGSIMCAYMDAGMQPLKAINTVARSLGESENKLAKILKIHIREQKTGSQKTGSREARRITAIRLAQVGWSNIEIGAELGVHANTIGRDIKKAIGRI